MFNFMRPAYGPTHYRRHNNTCRYYRRYYRVPLSTASEEFARLSVRQTTYTVQHITPMLYIVDINAHTHTHIRIYTSIYRVILLRIIKGPRLEQELAAEETRLVIIHDMLSGEGTVVYVYTTYVYIIIPSTSNGRRCAAVRGESAPRRVWLCARRRRRECRPLLGAPEGFRRKAGQRRVQRTRRIGKGGGRGGSRGEETDVRGDP